jgi:His/Glu/Gln/Arg/opine family amino acid ABC transporter permease subunit
MNFDLDVALSTLFSTVFLIPALTTIGVTFAAMSIAIVIGFLGALAAGSRFAALRVAVQFYLMVFRGVPILVQIVFWYNAMPILTSNAINLPPLAAGIIALSLAEGAYMTEIFRSGLAAVDVGQREAARALGMTGALSMRRIVLPQALKVIVPPTGNQFIAMLKTSSLLFVIAVPEIFAVGTDITSHNFKYFEVLLVVSIWYLGLSALLSFGVKLIEKRIRRGRSVAALPAMPVNAA